MRTAAQIFAGPSEGGKFAKLWLGVKVLNQIQEELLLFGLLTNPREQDYIDKRWPPRVSRDCTRLDNRQVDCIERGLTDKCESCSTFVKLLEDATE